MTTIFNLAALIAVTIIFVWGSIFERVRRIYPKMLDCPMCIGFWIGLAGSFIQYRLARTPLEHFFSACLVSILSLATHFGLLALDRLAGPPDPAAPPPPVEASSFESKDKSE